MPALLGWTHRYRLYQRLGPLWRALYQADPTIALDPPTVPDLLTVRHLRLRLYRRVIEIRDGVLALQPYRNPTITATRDGMRGRRLDAAIEAATIAAALSFRAQGAEPTTSQHPVRGGTDLDSDTTFLSHVARAYDDQEDFHEAIRTFLVLDPSALTAASPSIFAYYRDVMNDVVADGDTDWYVEIEGPQVVLNHVRLGNEATVRRDAYGDRRVYVSLECECDWEPEHGLQIVFRDGHTVTKVGPYDGHLTNAAA